MLIKLNINTSVKVKLDENGWVILKNWYDEVFKKNQLATSLSKSIEEHKKDMIGPDGLVTFQLWNLMQIFGQHVAFGKEGNFGINIFIDEKFLNND